MALLTLDFESGYLKGNTKIGVILPDRPHGGRSREFYQSGKKYKVLWLLHGGGGDYSDWIRKSCIELYACEQELAVVMPSASNSWYLDWEVFGSGYFFEQYFIKELMPMIYSRFPVSDCREDNYIGGLAMGGRGAFMFGIEHPDKFEAVINLSGDLPDWEKQFEITQPRAAKRIKNLTAMAGGREELLYSRANIRRTLEKIAADGKMECMPRMFFAGGRQEPRHGDFLDSLDFCEKLGLKITKGNDEGGHCWEYWDRTMEEALHFLQEGEGYGICSI